MPRNRIFTVTIGSMRSGAVPALLGFDPETPTVTSRYDGGDGVANCSSTIAFPVAAVIDVAAIVLATWSKRAQAPAMHCGSAAG